MILRLLGLLGAASFALAACSGGSGPAKGPAGSAGVGGSGGSGGSGGGGNVTCRPAIDFTVAAPACNQIANDATGVPFTARTGTAPRQSGGPIRDGLYHATRAEGYGAASPSGRKLTIAILDGATRMLWSGEVLDAAGAQTTLSFTANATMAISGTTFSLTTTCSSEASSPLPGALGFTATADELVLALDTGTAASVTTYSRVGCP